MSNESGEAVVNGSSRVRIGFRTSIITLFVSILLFVGLALVYLSFSRVTAITEAAAARYLAQVASHAADQIDAQFKDVHDSLEVLKQLPSVQSQRIADNVSLYSLMAAMLRNNVHLFNCYIGYDDGNFLQMDVIDRAGSNYRNAVGTPEGAEFRLLLIAGSDSERLSTERFLSDSLEVLATKSSPAQFDPRTRPWYRDAHEAGAGIITDPYIFFATSLPGYTVRAPIPRGASGVVAGDVLLSEAATMLRRQELGRSGKAFLFDDHGRVLAHPDLASRIRSGDAKVDLPTLTDVDDVGVAAAIRGLKRTGNASQVFRGFDGRMFAAAFQPIRTAASADLRLVVFAPLEEFFADIESERFRLFGLTIAFVAAMIPLAFWAGSLMSRRLCELADETDRIQRFQPSRSPRVRSVIREIDDLGRSVHTLRSVVQTFSRFVPRRLVQQLVENGHDMTLGGERREVTVMFTDVVDFTSITERQAPEKVMLYTSRYFASLSRAIMERGGIVDKFIGDAVMAIWNAPADDPAHVRNACDAALDCLDANAALNEAFQIEGWPEYRTRFGLHMGEALVGNVGSADRMNFTALGANVNLAARLEALNKNFGTSILVSAAVRDLASDAFVFRFIDRIRPKGFDATFDVFELRCRRNDFTVAEAAFCDRWNELLRDLHDMPVGEAVTRMDAFLDAYPDDHLGRHHAKRYRMLA